MEYSVETQVDHSEQYNCKKPDHGKEQPLITYRIEANYLTEKQRDAILVVVKDVFQEHLDEETVGNLRRLDRD
jgi:hypothetical protein